MQLCDLHTHSNYSDGTLTPLEIIDSAINIGLKAVALTDHNTVAGIPDFLSAAKDKNIEAIPGAEFTVGYGLDEIHLVGLYLPESSFDEITSMMKLPNQYKEESNIALVEALNKAGYTISYEDIKTKNPNGNINRSQIAMELLSKGYIATKQEAFDTILHPSAGYYVEPKRICIWDMLDFLNSINAVTVLAHPLHEPFSTSGKPDVARLETFLQEASKRGLTAMECYYSTYDEDTTDISISLTDKYGLLYSGGSDFHGSSKPDIALGFGHGNLKIPYKWAQNLKAKI